MSRADENWADNLLRNAAKWSDYFTVRKCLKMQQFQRWRGEAPPPNENSYTSQMVRTIKYFAEL